jgi:hypothetical protein
MPTSATCRSLPPQVAAPGLAGPHWVARSPVRPP